jgi:peptidyl-prolyl cis-trans isomerase B (cyclophilin B)
VVRAESGPISVKGTDTCVPTNKQRREQARRHLERQLARRVETDSKRKRRNLIATISASVVVVVVIVVVLVMLTNDDKKKPSAAATPTTSDSATDSASPSASSSAPAEPLTSGPCGYTQTATPATKDVGIPPDPTPTPTTNRDVTIASNQGNLTLSLDASISPCHTQAISYLVGKGFYDGTSCFRLVTQGIFVLQCGDPANDGSGGPGFTIKDENLDKVDYSVVGTVAMANAGPDTDGSQFFIIYKNSAENDTAQTGLGKNYTEIGHITVGMDIVQKIVAGGETDASTSSPGDGKPKIALTFTKVTVAPPVVGSGTLVSPTPSAPAASTPASAAPSSTPAASPTTSKSS